MPDIHTAILEVYKVVGYVQKERGKPGSGISYTFATEHALIEALRPAMVEAGIVMHITAVDEIQRETYQSRNDTPMNRTCIRATVRFTHAVSGTFIDVQALGEGTDPGDKGTPKALTGAFKYALRQTFCIETGDDPDEESSEGQARQGRSERDTPQPAPLNVPSVAACPHGARIWKQGTSKTGQPYRGWFCPASVKDCKPVWVNEKPTLAEDSGDVPFAANEDSEYKA